MKIIIHGTYGGYKILTPEHTVIVNDVRSESANYCAGVSFYSVAFNGKVVEYTKFVCIRDLNRSNAAGNIAITISCQDGERISGRDTLDILDELTNEFCQKYVHNSYFDVIPESWDFINKYQQKSVFKTRINQLSTHTDAKICAFCYYSGKEELSRLLDYPDKANYSSYKQVFLVDKSLKGSVNNPVTNYLGRIDSDADLTNRYLLKYVESDSRITVTQNGKTRENHTEIPIDGAITIEYFKEYHKKVDVTINLNNTAEYAQYVTVDDAQQSVVVNSITLEPDIRPIEIVVINEQYIKVPGESSVDCTNDLGVKKYPKLGGSIIEFVGEEIGKNWVVSATSSDKKESGRRLLVPGRLMKPQLELMVSEPKSVRLEAHCGEDNILSVTEFVAHSPNFAVKTPNDHKELVFYGDEKFATWEVEASSRICVTKKLQLVPKSQDSLRFEMKKTQQYHDFGTSNYTNTKKPFPAKLVAIIVTLLVVVGVAIFIIVNNSNKKKAELSARANEMSETIGNLLNSNKIDGIKLEELNKKLNENPKLLNYNINLKTYKNNKDIEKVLKVYRFIKGQQTLDNNIIDDKIKKHECFAKQLESIENDDNKKEVIGYMNKQFKDVNVIDIDEVCDFIDAYISLTAIKNKAIGIINKGIEKTKDQKIKMEKEVDNIDVNKWVLLNSYKEDVKNRIDDIKTLQNASGANTSVSFANHDVILTYLNTTKQLDKNKLEEYKNEIQNYNNKNNNKEIYLLNLVNLCLDLWETSNSPDNYSNTVTNLSSFDNNYLKDESPLKEYLKKSGPRETIKPFKYGNLKINL